MFATGFAFRTRFSEARLDCRGLVTGVCAATLISCSLDTSRSVCGHARRIHAFRIYPAWLRCPGVRLFSITKCFRSLVGSDSPNLRSPDIKPSLVRRQNDRSSANRYSYCNHQHPNRPFDELNNPYSSPHQRRFSSDALDHSRTSIDLYVLR